jgi:dTDP-4-amino-4,6-dideoxy-D-galactose acyltransferase
LRIVLKILSRDEVDVFDSPIDTQYFGVNSAIAVLNKTCSSVQRQNELLCFLQEFEFTTIRNRMNDPLNNCWLGEKTHSFLTDMNMQLRKKVSNSEKHDDKSLDIVENMPENPRITQIAETSFLFSRFLNDPYLPAEKAKAIYGDITKNAFGKEGRFFAIHKANEVVTGFLLFSFDKSVSTSTIELVAIDQNYRGNSIGRSLIRSMEYYVSKMAIDTIRVGTQLSNIDALNFYTSIGFRYLECNSIYHYWPHKLRNISNNC